MAQNHVVTEAVVRRSIEDVWAIVGDADRFAEWNARFWFSGGPFVQGKQLRLVIAIAGPIKARVPVEVTAFAEDHELRWDATFLGFRGSHWIRLEKVSDTETRILHGEDFTGLSRVWSRVEEGIRTEYQAVTDALAAYVERGASAS